MGKTHTGVPRTLARLFSFLFLSLPRSNYISTNAAAMTPRHPCTSSDGGLNTKCTHCVTSRLPCYFWQIYGWDQSGKIELRDVTCDNNTATEFGGCFNTLGRGIVTNGTVMHGNVAYSGGCICEFHSVGVCRAVVELQ